MRRITVFGVSGSSRHPRPAALLRDGAHPRGASVERVQFALGHSTPTVTLNTYVHEWPDVLDRTRSLVDAVLGGRQTAATSSRSRA
jgi:integrase